MPCSLETQLKVIAVVETLVSTFFLGLNVKILIELLLGHIDQQQVELTTRLSESAMVMYFLIRVLYLLGELLLAIFLTYNVHRKNVNGLILWFLMTIIFSIPSRCYFIGGILWGHFFLATVLSFSGNLAFTAYSLIIICLHVKDLTASRSGSACEYTDTYLDFL
ncbi:unnamed protein product [Orchesella dallaii]|uniref:Transmembrane protein n=1 Tax=Orchesella dallaii TaxID=48710 RepID=A0ABP1Q8K8_9HEXA